MEIKVRARVFVATPTYTGCPAHECALAMQIASIHSILRGVVLDWQFAAGFSLVQHGRNWLNAEFLTRRDCTHLLWLDDDVSFTPDAIVRMLERDLDVVAGVYTNKNPVNPEFPYEALGPVIDGLQDARKVPGGFMLLKRKVVENISDCCETYVLEHDGQHRRSPHLFDLALVDSLDFPGEKALLGEDYVLCHRLLETGYKIAVETDIDFIHMGRRGWVGNLAKTLAAEAEAGITGQGSDDAIRKNQAMVANDAGDPAPLNEFQKAAEAKRQRKAQKALQLISRPRDRPDERPDHARTEENPGVDPGTENLSI